MRRVFDRFPEHNEGDLTPPVFPVFERFDRFPSESRDFATKADRNPAAFRAFSPNANSTEARANYDRFSEIVQGYTLGYSNLIGVRSWCVRCH